MNPERFARVRGILLDLLELSPEERAHRVERLCRGDPELRAEIESLLARRAESGILTPDRLRAAVETMLAEGRES